jgi:hypothetical protein
MAVVVVAATGAESISRHFCSQWREGQRSETPCSSICHENRQHKISIFFNLVFGEGRNRIPSH